MHELQRYATRQQGAPASQLAFIEPGGRLHHCETGWKDGVWGDSQLEPDTRFRFASVTKPVTAAAILELINRNKLSPEDRKSTRLNSSHVAISYAVFCLKKKKKHN